MKKIIPLEKLIEIIDRVDELNKKLERYENIYDMLLYGDDDDLSGICKLKIEHYKREIDKYKNHENELVRLNVYKTKRYDWKEFADDTSSLIKLKLMQDRYLKTSWLNDEDAIVSNYAEYVLKHIESYDISLSMADDYDILIDDAGLNKNVA